MMAVAFIVWVMDIYNPRTIKIYNRVEERTTAMRAFLFFAVVVFFVGLRSGIADTVAYRNMFIEWPSELAEFDIAAEEKDKGFALLSVIFKQFISTDWQVWIFAIAFISTLLVVYPLYKHSPSFGFSAFLFIATTDFTWLMNGMRQFIVATALFFLMDWIISKKFVRFAIATLLLSTIHGSAVLMLPIYFVVQGKPWSSRMWISIITCVVMVFAFDTLMPAFGNALSGTQYDGYIDYMAADTGSNIMRAIVALVPVALAFIKRSEVSILNDKRMNLAINMSVFNFFCMLLASVSSGVFMGRLYIYFELYNLMLLPWLIKKVFRGQTRQLLTAGCIAAYLIWFYYQMVITWDYVYYSVVLNTGAWLN